MSWTMQFPTTSVSTSTHILSRGEPGYDESTNTLKIGDGTTQFVNLQAIGDAGSGDVKGPASATDHAIARFDAGTGKIIQNSGATIDDSGNITATGFVGNASTASKLATARTIEITGDLSGSNTFDGSGNVSIDTTLATVTTQGTYKSVTVDSKGRVTAGTNPTTLAGYGITDGALSSHNHSGVYQGLDADLTAIGALTGTSGLLKKTATNTWTLDTSAYSISGHTHAIANITGLQTVLDSKASKTTTDVLNLTIGNGKDLITTDMSGQLYVPYGYTITRWVITSSGTSGSIGLYLTYSTLTNHGIVHGSVGTGLYSLSSAWKNSGYISFPIPADCVISYYVQSTSLVKGVTLSLVITRTL